MTTTDNHLYAFTAESHVASVAERLEQAAKELTRAALELGQDLDYDTEGLITESIATVCRWAITCEADADNLRRAGETLRGLDVAGQELAKHGESAA